MKHVQIHGPLVSIGDRRAAFGGAALLLAAGLSAQSNPGEVLYEQKISETAGGFGGALDPSDLFGGVSECIGDLDGDGVQDLAVTAHFDDDGGLDRGAVWILFLNRDGTVKAEQKISSSTGGFSGPLDNEDLFGSGVANLGDLDGDDVVDIAVGAYQDDDGGLNHGAVWILFLNANGTVKSQQKISDTAGGFTGTLDDADGFGTGTECLGDLDGDGIVDLAVGAWADDDGGAEHGAVWILFLNANGTVKSHSKISETEGGFVGPLDPVAHFGIATGPLGDLDGPGGSAGALAVGCVRDDDGAPDGGAVWILFLSSSGTVLSQQKITEGVGGFTGDLDAGDHFGGNVTSLGDIGGGGVLDIAVAAPHDSDEGTDRGATWILSLDLDGTVVYEQKISSQTDNHGPIDDGDLFGSSLAGLGDLDLDGRDDLAVGARGDDDGGSNAGAMWILFLNDGSLDMTNVTVWESGGGGNGDKWDRATNWTQGIPDLTTTAIIPGDAAPFPRIRTSGESCKHLWIRSGASVEFISGSDFLEIHDGATLLGPITGPGGKQVRFVGDGVLSGSSSVSEPVVFSAHMTIQGGPLTFASTLTKTGATNVTLAASAELVVGGSTALTGGGTLSGSGLLDLNGTTTLAMSSTSPPDLLLAGNISINSSLVVPGTGLVVFDGSGNQSVTQLAASTPTRFFDLTIAAAPGLRTVTIPTAIEVGRDLQVFDGLSVTGSADVGGDVGGSNEGSIEIVPSPGGDCVLTDRGDYTFPGVLDSCQLVFDNPTSATIVIDTSSVAGTLVIRVGGVALLTSPSMTVGGGIELLNGRLDVQENELELGGTAPLVIADDLLYPGGGSLALGPGGLVQLDTNPVTVESGGTLSLEAGSTLRLGSSPVTVEDGGTLSLIGSPGAFARITGKDDGLDDGGYELTLAAGATLAARNFAFEEMASTGITVDRQALIASAPDDLRNGLFDRAAQGGRLLAIERDAPASFRYLRFEDTGPGGLKNVFVPATSAPITLVNWSGAFAGPVFEDDPGAKLTWGLDETTLLSTFRARRLVLQRVSLAWRTLDEVDCEAFVLERGPSAGGPWSALGERAASGPGVYESRDVSALPGTAYHYRLSERLTHGALRVLGTAFVNGSAPPKGQPVPALQVLAPDTGGSDSPPATIQSSLESLASSTARIATLELAPGTYASFDIDRAHLDDRSLRLVAKEPGTVRIDASQSPVRVRGLVAGASVELVGLVIETRGAPHPALVIEDCAGTVLLAELRIEGGVELDGASAVFLQGCVSDALTLDHGARADASGGALERVELRGSAFLETFGLALAPSIEPGSRWVAHAARRPRLDLVEASPSRVGTVRLVAPAGTLWWLLAAPELGAFGPTGAASHARAVQRLGGMRIVGPDGLDLRDLAWPIEPPVSLDALHLRALVVEPRRRELVLSELGRLVPGRRE